LCGDRKSLHECGLRPRPARFGGSKSKESGRFECAQRLIRGAASNRSPILCGKSGVRISTQAGGGGGGMSLIEIARKQSNNPLDVVERMAAGNDWPFERSGEDEIALVVTGRWTNYQVSFTWMNDIEALHLACAFDMKVPEPRLADVLQLIALINEQLWIGHFDVWMQNGVVMFRHALVLAGGVAASSRQCEAVLGSGLDSCERYYPAFQFVVWAGKSAREAMDSAMFETSGEA
jgi:hypothetical protein